NSTWNGSKVAKVTWSLTPTSISRRISPKSFSWAASRCASARNWNGTVRRCAPPTHRKPRTSSNEPIAKASAWRNCRLSNFSLKPVALSLPAFVLLAMSLPTDSGRPQIGNGLSSRLRGPKPPRCREGPSRGGKDGQPSARKDRATIDLPRPAKNGGERDGERDIPVYYSAEPRNAAFMRQGPGRLRAHITRHAAA